MVSKWSWGGQTIWCVVVGLVLEVTALSGPNVCMVQQKYNITKRVKYRAPMSVRTYEWCFAMPPRCSKWSTEMRELTRLETGERIAEVAVCCPGYKMRDVTCVPICPSGKMGNNCSEDCPADKWGPNCAKDCGECNNGYCDSITGECECDEGWQGESCQVRMPTTSPPALMEKLLTTTKSTVQTLATSVPTTLTTISTSIMQILSTSKPSLSSSIFVTTSTEKTENTPKTSTSQTTITSVVNPTLSYENVTPSTTLWVDNKEKFLKTTVTNFIYNRTETSEAGTSSTFPPEHVTSTSESRISKNTTISMSSLSSTYAPTTITTLLTVPVTIPSSTTTALKTSSTTTINVTEPSTIEHTTTAPSTITSVTPTVSSTVKRNSTTTEPKINTVLTVEKEIRAEPTPKIETTTKNQSTSVKFKPKEIWIKPSQKGESIFLDTKFKTNHEMKHKITGNKSEVLSENTTPKTIIVSIIPTSISHATFKKIALTTATYSIQRTNITTKPFSKTEQGYTKSMAHKPSTALPFTIKILSPFIEKNETSAKTTHHLPRNNTEHNTFQPTSKKYAINTTHSETSTSVTKSKLNTGLATSRTTNSMLFVESKNMTSSTISAKISSTNHQTLHRNSSHVITTPPLVFKRLKAASAKIEAVNKTTKADLNTNITDKGIATIKTTEKPVKMPAVTERTNSTKRNASKILNFNRITTQETTEDETFHILTEPEHITAVMSDRERDHTSLDLISVISIAGGVMMAVITVAVVIVMIERCKRHRYDDVRKINDIRMQVIMDNNDEPPPYVRSIFHTPLPEPPTTDRNHYQPISTLDRNLKQFMRPVVVQAISPVMLENFRGILECHYDHLPHTNQDFGTIPVRCSVASSMKYDEKLLRQRPLSVADYTIDSLKCEAKLDVIDCTTSEPLYAEIPCWRPPSEHAIEVVNLNGEAVTEL
ncbi:mucin-2 isoform X1 [Danaus plexippus]|uniref:mucin-2 isoform X1 n=1 Tax=Danaus plexippus TaxID=13037 RepID=UPI002AB01BEA|nr:mucin-2 isoform X1 [Danaus plexippus]XP_061377666.1 mucin-2 isoform X1 [Danaus plexippus]